MPSEARTPASAGFWLMAPLGKATRWVEMKTPVGTFS